MLSAERSTSLISFCVRFNMRGKIHSPVIRMISIMLFFSSNPGLLKIDACYLMPKSLEPQLNQSEQ